MVGERKEHVQILRERADYYREVAAMYDRMADKLEEENERPNEN